MTNLAAAQASTEGQSLPQPWQPAGWQCQPAWQRLLRWCLQPASPSGAGCCSTSGLPPASAWPSGRSCSGASMQVCALVCGTHMHAHACMQICQSSHCLAVLLAHSGYSNPATSCRTWPLAEQAAACHLSAFVMNSVWFHRSHSAHPAHCVIYGKAAVLTRWLAIWPGLCRLSCLAD